MMINNQKKENSNKKSKRGFWQTLCILFGLAVLFYPKRKEIKGLAKQEKDKFVHIIESECEHVRVETEGFFAQMMTKIKDSFIPHLGNNHRPHALSTKALKTYAILLIAIKVLVVGFLFFTYPNPAILSQKIAEQVFALTNESRTEAGVKQLARNDYLARAAQRKADDMVANNYFAHIGPDGKQPWQWINKGEYQYLYMGENLAMDFTTAEIVHSAFSKSPSHWKNIVNANYQEMGIGVAVGQIEGRDTIVLVEFFGAQTSASLAAASQPPLNQPAIEQPAVTPPSEPNQPVPPVNQPPEAVKETLIAPEPVISSVVQPTNQTETFVTEEIEAASEITDNENVITAGEEISNQFPEKLVAEISRPEVFSAGSELRAVAMTQTDVEKGLVDYAILISRYIFLICLAVLMILLILNVVIKPHIQHSAAILQTLALLALLSTFIFVKFHFLEDLPIVLVL